MSMEGAMQPIPKVSIFIFLTTKKSDRKGSKICLAKKALKWQGHGTGDIFYQCLLVTKFCAKFGYSLVLRAASAFHSFTVYVKGASPF